MKSKEYRNTHPLKKLFTVKKSIAFASIMITVFALGQSSGRYLMMGMDAYEISHIITASFQNRTNLYANNDELLREKFRYDELIVSNVSSQKAFVKFINVRFGQSLKGKTWDDALRVSEQVQVLFQDN